MTTPDASLITDLAKALDAQAIPYMIIGGQAVLVHGRPRMTADIDVTVQLSIEALPTLINAVADLPVHPSVDDIPTFVATTHVLPMAATSGPLGIDFVLADTPYESHAIQRSVAHPINDYPVRFACVEDLVILKIIAQRSRDLDDVREILLRHPDIDLTDIRHWLTQFAEVLEAPLLESLDQILRDINGHESESGE